MGVVLQAVQYPWRFNIILCLAAVPIGALFLTEVLRLSWQKRTITLGIPGRRRLVHLLRRGLEALDDRRRSAEALGEFEVAGQ